MTLFFDILYIPIGKYFSLYYLNQTKYYVVRDFIL